MLPCGAGKVRTGPKPAWSGGLWRVGQAEWAGTLSEEGHEPGVG